MVRFVSLALVLTLAGCGAQGLPGAAVKPGARVQVQAKAGIVAAFTATAKKAIARMDKDGDGRLARTEVDEHVSGSFDQIDGNGDGQITLQELVAHHASPEMVDYIHAEILANFADADQDKSRALDAKEFAWVQENPNFYTSKLRSSDFQAADKNRDGKLTASEFEDRAAATSL